MTTPELPPLPPLGRFSQDFHRMRVMQDGAWCPYDDVKAIDDAREARECILVAEIERLRALWMAAEERAGHAEEAALSHAEKIERLRASLQIEKDAAALSYKNGMALGEQLHDCQCTVRELRAECEAMRADAERYRWLASKARKDTAYDRYGNGAHWIIGFFAANGRHALDAAIDAAREAKP